MVIHPEFWNRRRLVLPGTDPIELPTTSRRALEGAGFTIVEDRAPSFLFDGSVLITGEVERTSGFEPGFPPQQAWRDGRWEPDPLVLDDQALIVHVRDRGLLVLTGCGHAGIVNITRYARRLTGIDRVHAVIGGFHLGGPAFEPLIRASATSCTPSPPASSSPPTAPAGPHNTHSRNTSRCLRAQHRRHPNRAIATPAAFSETMRAIHLDYRQQDSDRPLAHPDNPRSPGRLITLITVTVVVLEINQQLPRRPPDRP